MTLGPTCKDPRSRCVVAVVAGIAMDSSDARSVWSVASRRLGSTPPPLCNPDVVCYLSIAW